MAGLADYLENVMGSPLFLSGAALASGEGFGGAMQGMAAGGKFREQARKRQIEQQRDAFLAGLSDNPDFKNVDPRLIQTAQASRDPALVASSVAGERSFNLEKLRTEAEIAAKKQAMAVSAAQLQQYKSQTPEARHKALIDRGIDPNTPEGQAFILNGTYTPKDPVSAAIGQMLAPAIKGAAPAAAPAQPSPIQPQSNDGTGPGATLWDAGGQAAGDPNIVRVDDRTAPPAATPEPTVTLPLFGTMPEKKARDIAGALSLSGKGEAGKLFMEEVNRDKLAKEANNENQKGMLKDYETLQNVRNIRASLDPKFLEIPTKAGMAWSALKDSFGKLTPDKQQELYRFATFRKDSAEMFNTAIKNNSGATVTEQEFRRNGVQYANAGSGIFDGDGPTEFKAKLDRGEEVIMLGLARRKYLQDQGFRGPLDQAANLVPVERMRDVIRNRAAAIGTEIKARNPQADPASILQETERRVRKEFGI